MYIERLQEKSIIKYLQFFVTNDIIYYMNLLSSFIYNKIFLIIIIIFYLLKYLTTKQIILLILVHPIVGILKHLIKRNRPFVDSTIKLYDVNIIDKYSFPSGHTTFSFLIYFILLDNKIINKYYIVFPLLVGFSRIILGAHYITDVIGGIILAKLLSLL